VPALFEQSRILPVVCSSACDERGLAVRRLFLTSFLLSILLILGFLAAKAQSGSYPLGLSSWVLLALILTWASLSLFSWWGLGSGRRTLIARVWLGLMSCVVPYTVLDVGLGLVLIEKLKSIEIHDERVTVFRSVLNKLSGSVRKSPGR
jgi:membrane protease YdiL (CAAX protease family)